MATVVSCYYCIPSKHTRDDYDAWIRNFMNVDMQTIIYVNEESYALLQPLYPENEKRKYKLRELKDFVVSKYDWEKEITLNTKPCPGHNSQLFQIWAEKIHFVQDAITNNIYGSDVFVWMDIGCIRNSASVTYMKGFPDCSQIDKDFVTLLQLEPWIPTDNEAIKRLSNTQFMKRTIISGSIFGGGKDIFLKFIEACSNIVEEADRNGIFKGEDQYIYAWCALRHPDIIKTVNPTPVHWNSWFALQQIWSTKPLHFVFVGPGLMPIPPIGWGACEILIWDMAQNIRKLGHKVDIINTTNMSDVVETIKKTRPDFVHIQYDDYAGILSEVAKYSKAVAITSHYGYLDQQKRWGYYQHIFQRLLGHRSSNIYHFALSESIKEIYLQYGIPKQNVFVTPNGADETLFRYTTTPKYPERSIVVGKIEARKGQFRLININDVWFAGNKYDSAFDYTNPRYLGEWNKSTLYDSLTDYGNLILLSDGEADALVIKEAFVAGLGIVISEWATANLDLSKPFITVIPSEKLNDSDYVAQKVKENRDISVQFRNEIKEYSKTFSWSTLMKSYVGLVRSLI